MISFTALQRQLIEAHKQEREAWQADADNLLLDHTKNYSHDYLLAYWHYRQAKLEWHVAYEEVCFPLTAIGVLYDPSVEFMYDEDDTPTVKLAALKIITAKLPVVEFPEVAA